jgi:hypothetical protein
MENQFKITRTSREIYNRFFDNYTLEQLNKVPQGFNNNLIWNIGHIVVSQQMLVYLTTGQEPMVSKELIAQYMRGTKPERDITQQEADEIKALLFTTIDKSEADYNAGIFTTFNPRKTELGFELNTVEDAITFNNYHEATHLGMMMSLKKFV